MPTNDKPKKTRKSNKNDIAPGQIWADLTTLHQTCLSLLRNGTSVAPILKDPTFIENTEDIAEVTNTAKAIAAKLPGRLETLNKLQASTATFRAEWDRFDGLRRVASKARDLGLVQQHKSTMDNVEFSALGIGEAYQHWIAEWQQDVAQDIIKLLSLVELTRVNMEKKQNATN